jgi:hypothetical protein
MIFIPLSSTTQQLRSRVHTGSLGLLYSYFIAFVSKAEKCIGQPLLSVELIYGKFMKNFEKRERK